MANTRITAKQLQRCIYGLIEPLFRRLPPENHEHPLRIADVRQRIKLSLALKSRALPPGQLARRLFHLHANAGAVLSHKHWPYPDTFPPIPFLIIITQRMINPSSSVKNIMCISALCNLGRRHLSLNKFLSKI